MTRLEKCIILESKGFTYDAKTGKVFGIRGREIKNRDELNYIRIGSNHIKGNLYAHHFAWYMSGKNMNFDRLDHKNRVTDDNRIENLRIITNQENSFNTNAKGYSLNKKNKKWVSQICLDGKLIYLGSFNTEQEARNVYLDAKKKYHII
jgi:hypothetical protein